MTPEREAEIRAVLNGDQSVGMDEALIVMSKAADDLLDEVDRLRAGIEGIKAKALDHRKTITEGPLVGRILVSHWCDNALLNPTEGEDR